MTHNQSGNTTAKYKRPYGAVFTSTGMRIARKAQPECRNQFKRLNYSQLPTHTLDKSDIKSLP